MFRVLGSGAWGVGSSQWHLFCRLAVVSLGLHGALTSESSVLHDGSPFQACLGFCQGL